MGTLKNLHQEVTEDDERRWQHVCQAKGFKCGRCGTVPLKSERDVYFDTGYCGACAPAAEKMKDE